MTTASPTFILIPGAWHTASSWAPVAQRLRGEGRATDIIELPGQRTSGNEPRDQVHLSDAVAALTRHVDDHDLDDAILVGHSLGGYVIGGALEAIAPRVRQIIYYAAHIPIAGVSMADAFPERMAPLRAAAEASPDGSVPVPAPELIAQAFLPGASPDLQRLIGELLVPTPGAYFLESLPGPTRPQDHGLRASYVLGEQDLILPPPADQFPAMLGLAPVMIAGGHESLFLDPELVARTLLEL